MQKEEISHTRRCLMKRADVIRKKNKCHRSQALTDAHNIHRLIEAMHHGPVTFSYTKQDGSVRHARGTLTGYEHQFKRPYQRRTDNTFVVYYDLDADGWRTFRAENFLSAQLKTTPL